MDFAATVARLTPQLQAYVNWQERWINTARPAQIPPEDDWSECGVMAGRGFGKTRTGAEWLGRATFEDPSGLAAHVIAPTLNDIKFTCFRGRSGLLSVIPPDLILDTNTTDHTITMRNIAGGSTLIRGFSADQPERLRGPECTRCWGDELAAWQYAEEAWDMMQMGLRLGTMTQVLWTTTPKPRDIIRRLTTPEPGRLIVKGTTYDNRANLSKTFYDKVVQYEGTTIGRQELLGELIDPEEQGVIRRSWIRLWPAAKRLPQFDMIIMSLDTAFTEATMDSKTHDPDYTACTVWASFKAIRRMADKDEVEHHLLLLDCWEERLGLPDLILRVKREMNTRYGEDEDTAIIRPIVGSAKPITSGRKPDLLIIEDKGSGISLRQSLVRHKIEAHAYNPGRMDKLSRLHLVSPMFARRAIWIPESEKLPGKPKSWAEPLIQQLTSYAGEGSLKHDDYVDSTTQCLRVLLDKGFVSVVKPRKPKPEDEEPLPRQKVVNPYAA
jgi:predicted phage terminase large subunit-like protein